MKPMNEARNERRTWTGTHASRRARSGARPVQPNRPLGSTFRTPLWHRIAERAIAACAFTSIAAIVLIFAFVAREAIPILWEAGREEGFRLIDLVMPRQWKGYDESVLVWQPVGNVPKYNLVPLFVGTFKVTTIAMLISVPVAVGAAVFVSQYASRRFREILKPIVELLAGIPSVVLGFFALMILASWVQSAFGLTYRLNGLVAALGLSVAIVPLVFTISDDALQAVPRHLSEASSALGARKWQTTIFVILPAALPGIAAAVILGFGRAIGETMIVLMASGNAAVVELFDASSSVRTVTATIAAELGEVARGELHWRILFLLGLLLFAVTFALNWLGGHAVARLHRKLTAAERP
jgi:phosphate transport system permease protein